MKKTFFVLIGLFTFAIARAQPDEPAHDLVHVFKLALENDPKFQQARDVRQAALESKPQAIAKLLPLLRASGGTNWNYLNNLKQGFQGFGLQRYWDHTFDVNLSQPLFHWDYWVQLSQSENQIARAEAEYQDAVQDLMVRTIQAYLNILLAKDTLRFANAEKESLARQLEQAQQRFNVGLIAITDVLEAQAGFDGARSREIFAENNLNNSIEALREIIGEYEGRLVPLPENIPLMKPEPLDINQWAFSADSQNLNIIAAQNQAELARKTIELQRSGHFPTVDVIGNYRLQDDNSTFGLRGDIGTVGVRVTLPIYEGGAVNSRTRQALHNFNAAKDNLLVVRRQVARQVKDAYRGVISTISQVEALKATVKSSMSALEATTAGFEVGTRTMVDVVNEQRNLFQAQNTLSEARNKYILNWVSLKESASNLSETDIQTLNNILHGSSGRESGAETNEAM
ncbi:MAG: TolC family outer membrane protein [Methylococcaceae bacterium]|nr:TolC family outer membrane protein [Methylococcaceae bacterium]MCI0733936.1 TolC family outer membrane protein [Methylococcaceae bacterium]